MVVNCEHPYMWITHTSTGLFMNHNPSLPFWQRQNWYCGDLWLITVPIVNLGTVSWLSFPLLAIHYILFLPCQSLMLMTGWCHSLSHRKFDRWKPTDSADEIAKKKKKASVFMGYLSSTMDHAVSQHCRIYQLKAVCIWPGESPDELVDHLQDLADLADLSIGPQIWAHICLCRVNLSS